MEIFRLFGNIFVDNEKANKSISETDKKAEGLTGKLGAGIKVAGQWGAKITAAAVAGGTALFAMANKAAGTTDRIDKLSQKIGISRQGFQEWEFVLSQSGTDIEKLQVGLKTMVQRMDETVQGTGQGARMFERLGVSVTDATGAMKSQEQVFEETVRALQNMPEGAEKSRLAFELFGKAGMELMPLLNDTNASLDDMKKMAHDMGMVISDEAVDAGVAFTDTMDQMKRSLGAIVTNIGAAVIPIFQEMADWVLAHMPEIQAVISTVFGVLETIVKAFIDVIKALTSTFQSWFDTATESGIDFQGYFQMFYDWFAEIFNLLKEIVQATLEAMQRFWKEHGENITAIVKPLFESIKIVIQTAMNVVKGILKTVLALIRGDWKGAWEGIKQIFVSIWNGIIQLLPNLLEGIYAIMRGAFGIFKSLGRGMFNMVWEGMKAIWTSISSWVSDKVSWLTDKLMFWKKSNKEMDRDEVDREPSRAIDGSHAKGLSYVPFDGYVAELHKGERVLTAEENKNLGTNYIDFEGLFNGANIYVRSDEDIKKIAKELFQLQQQAMRGRGLAPA